jgi:hypothetical protein
MAQEFSAKPDGLPASWARGFPDKVLAECAARRNAMHPEDLMKPDLLSEIVLLTFAALMLASMVLFVATMVVQS